MNKPENKYINRKLLLDILHYKHISSAKENDLEPSAMGYNKALLEIIGIVETDNDNISLQGHEAFVNDIKGGLYQ